MLASTPAALPRCLPAGRVSAASIRYTQLFHHEASDSAQQDKSPTSLEDKNASRHNSSNESPAKKSPILKGSARKVTPRSPLPNPTPTKSPFKILEKLNSTRRDLRPSALSLLEELFPVETANSRKAQSNKRKMASTVDARPARGVPWMPFDDGLNAAQHAEAEKLELSRRNNAFKTSEGVTLLMLRKASVHLCEADFRRVVPTGQHIEGWNTGSFSKIIRGRTPATLRPNGTYYLVFPTLEAAQAYKRNAEYLHEFNKRFDLSAKDAPIPPPPMLLDDGKRLEEPLTRFTLCLPSQELSLELVRQPFRPELRKIMEEGFIHRHDPEASGQETAEHRVLVDFENDKPLTYFLVRGAIEKDGDKRNMQWALSGAQGGIRWINLPQAQRRAPLVRFVLTFVDESEARRFCMEWHRRDVADLVSAVATSTESWHGEGPVIVNAEYIW